MPNLLGKSRLFLFLQNLSTKIRLLISFFILLTISFIFLFFFYFPLKQEINLQKKLQHDLVNLQNLYNNKLSSFNKIKIQNQQLNAKYKSVFNKQKKQKVDLDYLLNLINKNDLKYKNCLNYKSLNKDFYNKEYFDIKVKGNFNSIVSFLDQLDEYKSILKFKDLDIIRKNKNNVLFQSKIRILKF